MQYSLKKGHQHHKWQQQTSWISYPDCQVAQDKQLMQYLLIPKWKWKMHRRHWKFHNRNVQTFGYVYHDTKWFTSWSSMEDPVFPLGRNLYGHPLAGLLWERLLLKYDWEKVSNWECLIVHREKGLCLSVYVDDIKLDGKKQNIDPMWKVLNKEVDPGEPISFLDHVHLGCAQRQCEISKHIVDNYRTMFGSRISAGATEKLPCSEICIFLSGPMTWKFMPWNVWNDIVSWRSKRLNNFTKFQLHALTTIISKKKKWIFFWELSHVCIQIVLKCLYLARIGRPVFLMVSEQICTIDHKVDQSLWQTIISFDLLHSSYMWLQTILSSGKHFNTMQIGTVSRLRFCRRSWGFKIYITWNIVHFRKSYVCSNQLGV